MGHLSNSAIVLITIFYLEWKEMTSLALHSQVHLCSTHNICSNDFMFGHTELMCDVMLASKSFLELLRWVRVV